MDKLQAEQDLRTIREVMERAAKYTHFSGLSGVLSGLIAILGCAATWWVDQRVASEKLVPFYIAIWTGVLVAAIAEDFLLANRQAKRAGESILNPATYQVLKAVFPGVFVAFVLSGMALRLGWTVVVPAIWSLGYGVALCAAGMFSVKEVRYYGLLQLATGTVGLVLCLQPHIFIYQLALSFGVYQILFGLLIGGKYKKQS